jgi:hypothetical protein
MKADPAGEKGEKMMKQSTKETLRQLKKIFLFIFSIGWLVPVYWSFYSLFEWLNTDVSTAIYKKPLQFGSYYAFYYARTLFFIAFFWLCLVVIYWGLRLVFKTKTTGDLS